MKKTIILSVFITSFFFPLVHSDTDEVSLATSVQTSEADQLEGTLFGFLLKKNPAVASKRKIFQEERQTAQTRLVELKEMEQEEKRNYKRIKERLEEYSRTHDDYPFSSSVDSDPRLLILIKNFTVIRRDIAKSMIEIKRKEKSIKDQLRTTPLPFNDYITNQKKIATEYPGDIAIQHTIALNNLELKKIDCFHKAYMMAYEYYPTIRDTNYQNIINLSHNQLEHANAREFFGHNNIVAIDLSYNNIKKLQPYSGMVQLKSLNFSHNPKLENNRHNKRCIFESFLYLPDLEKIFVTKTPLASQGVIQEDRSSIAITRSIGLSWFQQPRSI